LLRLPEVRVELWRVLANIDELFEGEMCVVASVVLFDKYFDNAWILWDQVRRRRKERRDSERLIEGIKGSLESVAVNLCTVGTRSEAESTEVISESSD
jgi:hypothetical protein